MVWQKTVTINISVTTNIYILRIDTYITTFVFQPVFSSRYLDSPPWSVVLLWERCEGRGSHGRLAVSGFVGDLKLSCGDQSRKKLAESPGVLFRHAQSKQKMLSVSDTKWYGYFKGDIQYPRWVQIRNEHTVEGVPTSLLKPKSIEVQQIWQSASLSRCATGSHKHDIFYSKR